MSTHFLRNVGVFRMSDGFFALSDQGEQSGRGPVAVGMGEGALLRHE